MYSTWISEGDSSDFGGSQTAPSDIIRCHISVDSLEGEDSPEGGCFADREVDRHPARPIAEVLVEWGLPGYKITAEGRSIVQSLDLESGVMYDLWRSRS